MKLEDVLIPVIVMGFVGLVYYGAYTGNEVLAFPLIAFYGFLSWLLYALVFQPIYIVILLLFLIFLALVFK